MVKRMDKQKRIRSLVTRAGAVESPLGGAETFTSELILVLQGGHESSLDIFNQHGHQIGAADRSRGQYSRDGYQYRYELRDSEPRFLITDISKGRWVSVPKDYTITGADGADIASGSRGTASSRPRSAGKARRAPWDTFVFERNGEKIATLCKTPRKELRRARPRTPASNPIASLRRLYDRSFSSQLFYVEDQFNQEIARITYLSGFGVAYVLELQPGTSELLSTIAVAACVIADNAFISPPSGT